MRAYLLQRFLQVRNFSAQSLALRSLDLVNALLLGFDLLLEHVELNLDERRELRMQLVDLLPGQLEPLRIVIYELRRHDGVVLVFLLQLFVFPLLL